MNKEQLIQKYFKGSLSLEEEKELKSLLENDDDFNAQFEDYSNMNKAFKSAEAVELKEFLNQLEEKTVSSNTQWYKNSVLYYATAAILIISLCIPFLINPSPESIYENFYEAYPNVEQPIVRGAQQDDISKAFQDYENGNYNVATENFKVLLQKDSNPNYRFYYGMALLNDAKYEFALEELSKIENLDFDYKEETLWYQSLILIRVKKFEEAKLKLKRLDDLGSMFKSEERKLLLHKLEKQ